MCFDFWFKDERETRLGQLNGKCLQNGTIAFNVVEISLISKRVLWIPGNIEVLGDFASVPIDNVKHIPQRRDLSSYKQMNVLNAALLTFCKWAEFQLRAMHQVRQTEIHVDGDFSGNVSWSECVAFIGAHKFSFNF